MVEVAFGCRLRVRVRVYLAVRATLFTQAFSDDLRLENHFLGCHTEAKCLLPSDVRYEHVYFSVAGVSRARIMVYHSVV